MAAPTGILSSMGAHKLDVRYGDRNSLPYYNGVIDTGLSAALQTAIIAGKVMSITTGGKLVPGLINAAAAGATGGTVPYFLQNGLDANTYPDALRSRGMPGFLDKPAAGTYLGGTNGGQPFYGIPLSAGLVGSYATIQWKAAAELCTTEFEASDAATLVTGTPITAVRSAPTAGKEIQAGNIRTWGAGNHIVGYVAPAGVYTSPEGYSTLAFTPAYVVGAGATYAPDAV